MSSQISTVPGTVWDRVCAAAAEEPEAVALTDGTRVISRAELVHVARSTAAELRARGVRRGDVVALCAARSVEQVLALVAVLAAGAAVAPFDVRQATASVRDNLGRLRPAAVLADAEGLALFPDALPLDALPLDAPALDAPPLGGPLSTAAPIQAPPPAPSPGRDGPDPSDLAYVLHTSGSSGRPKPSLIPHRSVDGRFEWGQRLYPIGPGDTVLSWGSPVFDCSFWVLLAPLCYGASLLVAPDGMEAEPRRLAGFAVRHGATVMHFVPSLLREFLSEGGGAALASLRYVLIAGERLPGELVRQVFAASPARVFNQYGPTETCIDVLTHELTPDDGRLDAVPIGRPNDGVRAVVVDTDERPVPPGTAGELLIGGACVAWGYAGAPAATGARFVPDPFAGEPGARLYRTGDLVRQRADGVMEFLGRVDHQVKVRGVRVEPSDVEHELLRHPGIAQAAVVAVDDGTESGMRLVAHLVTPEPAPADAELRTFLARRLVSAAVPQTYVRHPGLPRLSSGKIDRIELVRRSPTTAAAQATPAHHEAPRSGTEERVALIWQEILKVPEVGRQSDFVALGGQSLLAMRMTARVRDRFGVRLPTRTVFGAPTLEQFAAALDEAVTAKRSGT